MGLKASLYLHELERKYGDVFAVREHLEEYYRKDLGDEFERYVIDYYETHPSEIQEIKEEHEKKIQVTTRKMISLVATLFATIVFLSPTILILVLYSSFKTWWLFAILSFLFFLDILVPLDAYFKRNFPTEKLEYLSSGLCFFLWGFLVLCYYFYISQSLWTLLFSSILIWLGSSIGLTGYLEKRMDKTNAINIGLTICGMPSLFFLWLIYESGASLILVISFGVVPYFTLVFLISFLSSVLKIGTFFNTIMQNEMTLYILFLFFVMISYYLVFMTLQGMQWIVSIFLIQRIISYGLKRNNENPSEKASTHGFISWGAVFLLSIAMLAFLRNIIFIFPSFIAFVFILYYLFRYRESQLSL